MANGKRGSKDTIRYCKKYGKKSGGKRKCRLFGRRKMTAKQKKYFS
jgi:hypothetical protein